MKFLDWTLPTPEENLACDEALLDFCEHNSGAGILRFWEAREHFIVLGYSNNARTEAHLDRARQDGIPVLRRCTGGGAVLQGPGCLNYSLILPITASIRETNVHIMQRHRDALRAVLGGDVQMKGQSDLTVGDLKFSGNAQRRKRRYLLFHGSFLLNLDIDRVERLLPTPSRQPDYRHNRPHREFLTNVDTESAAVKRALRQRWLATEPLREVPEKRIHNIARDVYAGDAWNFKF